MNDITQRNIRRIIGAIALLLPWVCMAVAWKIQSSISSYYFSTARDLLTGALLGIGTFLVAYQGYDKQDTQVSTVAGIAALVTGLVPGSIPPGVTARLGVLQLLPKASAALHGLAAAVLFLSIFYMVMFLFTKGSSRTTQKKFRNILYRICGLGILVGFAIFSTTILWSEVLMLTSFGIAWLVKGETLFQDQKA